MEIVLTLIYQQDKENFPGKEIGEKEYERHNSRSWNQGSHSMKKIHEPD